MTDTAIRNDTASTPIPLTKKDFSSDQEVRWCPGCGDYAILANVQGVMPTLGIPRENIVFVSGIGCAARFPYYMETYGFHSIHGRAPAIATGISATLTGLNGWSSDPIGVDFVILPSSLVGEYWPFVSP